MIRHRIFFAFIATSHTSKWEFDEMSHASKYGLGTAVQTREIRS